MNVGKFQEGRMKQMDRRGQERGIETDGRERRRNRKIGRAKGK